MFAGGILMIFRILASLAGWANVRLATTANEDRRKHQHEGEPDDHKDDIHNERSD